MKTKKRILVAPLDWGIGHASRCIPIIRELLKSDFEVVITANGRSEVLLRNEFPQLQFIEIKGYNIQYPKNGDMTWIMFIQAPKIFFGILKEHKTLHTIIDKYKIDGIISDNRFGMWSKKIPSVFITHQLEIQSKYFTNLISKINFFFINKYTECWVPDFKDNYLAGNLSENRQQKKNIKYIGVLSRFDKKETEKKYDLCFVISGPEPQRTLFEKMVIDNLEGREEKSIVLLGKPEEKEMNTIGNSKIHPHLNAEKLNEVFLQSDLIFCRSGYSTIMDLYKVNGKAVFIPTPGQTEQEYLAEYFDEKGICFTQSQSNFNIEEAMLRSTDYSGFTFSEKKEIDWKKIFTIFQHKENSIRIN